MASLENSQRREAGLQLRRRGRQKYEADIFWYDNLLALMPTCLIQYEDDMTLWASTNRLREVGKRAAEDLDIRPLAAGANGSDLFRAGGIRRWTALR